MHSTTAPASTWQRVGAPAVAGGVLVGACATLAVIDPTGGPTVCAFRAATGYDCPGCGATRALHHLFNGRLLTAMDFNVLAVLAAPFILWGLYVTLSRALGGPRWTTPSVTLTTSLVLLAVVVVFWVVRNLPISPFSALGSEP